MNTQNILSLTRTYELVQKTEQKDFRRKPREFLTKGAAAGADSTGLVSHFWPNKGLVFAGFVIDNYLEVDKVCVKTRGSVVLRIPGSKETDRGKSVFTVGPDAFSLKESPGAIEIGKIRYCQGERCAVAFRPTGDERPLDLSLVGEK